MSASAISMAGDCGHLENLSITGLVPLVKQLVWRVEAPEVESVALKAGNASLRGRLRTMKRPAAPFSKGSAAGTPEKPGRHQGEGRFEKRREPVPGSAHRAEELAVPLDSPDCAQCETCQDQRSLFAAGCAR